MNVKTISFQRTLYKELCEEMREVLTLEKDIAKRKEELRAQILEAAGGDRMEYGIKVQSRTRIGSIDYKALCDDAGIGADELEMYRKDDITFWEVKGY